MPMLEDQHHFSLCIHQRNFIPGHFIAENITQAVKNSRRTILLITSAFIGSDWCKFEYQVALQEMLKEKHRILPIVVGDGITSSSEMDGTLKSLLDSVTWLQYSINQSRKEAETFWELLILSMPKKRQSFHGIRNDTYELMNI